MYACFCVRVQILKVQRALIHSGCQHCGLPKCFLSSCIFSVLYPFYFPAPHRERGREGKAYNQIRFLSLSLVNTISPRAKSANGI